MNIMDDDERCITCEMSVAVGLISNACDKSEKNECIANSERYLSGEITFNEFIECINSDNKNIDIAKSVIHNNIPESVMDKMFTELE